MKFSQLLQEAGIRFDCINYEDLELEVEVLLDHGAHGFNTALVKKMQTDYTGNRLTLTIYNEDLKGPF